MIRCIIIFASLLFLMLSSCQSEKEVPVNELVRCSFNRLESYEASEVSSNDHTLNIEGTLNANLKFLKGIGGKLSIQDSITFYRTEEKYTSKVHYTSSFLEKHNSIINILCSIENEMRDSTLSIQEVSKLRNDLWGKRSKYFNLLIDGQHSDLFDQDTISDIINPKPSPVQTHLPETEISIYLNKDMLPVESIKINNIKIALLPTSTKTNIRFFNKLRTI